MWAMATPETEQKSRKKLLREKKMHKFPMGQIPTRVIIWSLKRYTRDKNLWDHVCSRCKQTTPVFEYEHRSDQEQLAFSYLCDGCAQKKLAEWLQCAGSPDYVQLGYLTDFDIATVFYEQKNDEESLLLTRWSSEQKRRRLQVDEE